MDALSNLGINIGYLIMQIAIVVILYLVLKQFLFAPVQRTLEARQECIAKGLEDARQAALARDNADVEAKKILEQARAEAAKVRQDAAAQAEESAKGIVANANEEARNIVSAAHEDAEQERNRILSDLRSQVASIAIAAAEKLVDAKLDKKRQHELIEKFFTQLPADVSQVRGKKAIVTSALTLEEAEKAKIEKALNVDEVEFKVDPKILGGLIVRVGDQVIDGSVASRMDNLRDSLD